MEYHTTKEGNRIKLSEMSDSHLINTVMMIDRYAANGLRVRSGIEDSFSGFREVYFDVYIIYGKEVHNYFDRSKYIKELKRRGIKYQVTISL